MVKSQMTAGAAPPSVCATLIQNHNTSVEPSDELFLAWTVGNIYAGGSDTTVSSLTSFYLAMCYAPDVQRKAQREIDLFANRKDRWPNIEERNSFPYVQALITEIYRWGLVAPLGIPHRLLEALPYRSFTIPQDTTLLTNAWAICHDPKIYPNPFRFDPERFLGDDPQVDPREVVFGGGRRICPGIDMADAIMFMTVAAILSIFNIDPNPECPPSYTYVDRMARHPTPFLCQITIRSTKATEWISQAMSNKN